MKEHTSTRQRITEVEAAQKRKELKQTRMMRLFIQEAERLICEGNIHNLSTRKLADATGYSSAALYSYFEDLDELVIYASFKHQKGFMDQAAKEITEDMSSLEQYRRVYQIFNDYTFRNPEIYMNMYFGKHSDKLKDIMERYYALFPDEFPQLTPLIRRLLLQANLFASDKITTPTLAKDGFIAPENAEIVAELMVRVQETFLYDCMINPYKDIHEQNEKFLQIFDRIIEAF